MQVKKQIFLVHFGFFSMSFNFAQHEPLYILHIQNINAQKDKGVCCKIELSYKGYQHDKIALNNMNVEFLSRFSMIRFAMKILILDILLQVCQLLSEDFDSWP